MAAGSGVSSEAPADRAQNEEAVAARVQTNGYAVKAKSVGNHAAHIHVVDGDITKKARRNRLVEIQQAKFIVIAPILSRLRRLLRYCLAMYHPLREVNTRVARVGIAHHTAKVVTAPTVAPNNFMTIKIQVMNMFMAPANTAKKALQRVFLSTLRA